MGSRSLSKEGIIFMNWTNEEEQMQRQRQLDVIGMIPDQKEVVYADENPILSNKFDVPDFGQLTDKNMEEFERRHLQELAEQTRKYDLNEQMVVAENLDPFVCFNAVGKWMDMTRDQLAQASTIFQPQEESNG